VKACHFPFSRHFAEVISAGRNQAWSAKQEIQTMQCHMPTLPGRDDEDAVRMLKQRKCQKTVNTKNRGGKKGTMSAVLG